MASGFRRRRRAIPLFSIVNHALCIMNHESCIIHRASCILLHESCIIHRASCILLHESCIIHRASCILLHESCIIHRASPIVHRASCIVNHASCIAHCASLIFFVTLRRLFGSDSNPLKGSSHKVRPDARHHYPGLRKTCVYAPPPGRNIYTWKNLIACNHLKKC